MCHAVDLHSFIHSFIYFSVDLLQDMEIVMSIIVQEEEEKKKQQHTVHTCKIVPVCVSNIK